MVFSGKSGEKFETHQDGFSTNSKGERSFMTVLIYLNQCQKGGETRYFEEPFGGISFQHNRN